MVNTLSQFSAQAVMPDQLLPYVQSISRLESQICGSCLLHKGADRGVLIGYPLHDPFDTQAMNEAVELALQVPGLNHLSVLAPEMPKAAPDKTAAKKDYYWSLPIPAPGQDAKLRNMLKRAARDVEIRQESGHDIWTEQHAGLARQMSLRHQLDAGSLYLFDHLSWYLAGTDEARLFSAYTSSGELAACAIADYTAFGTAFYMFAFRSLSAPPGTADLLLSAILEEAHKRGHIRLNLGLGINPGVEFFKRKWRAQAWLPYLETGWFLKKSGFWKKLFRR